MSASDYEDLVERDRLEAENAKLRAELAARDELLRKARPYVEDAARNGDDGAADYAVDLGVTIDALLNEGGGDE